MIINSNKLRKKVKVLCALQDITYKEISEYLDIKIGSFYNYMSGSYELSEEKQILLNEILDTLTEVELNVE